MFKMLVYSIMIKHFTARILNDATLYYYAVCNAGRDCCFEILWTVTTGNRTPDHLIILNSSDFMPTMQSAHSSPIHLYKDLNIWWTEMKLNTVSTSL